MVVIAVGSPRPRPDALVALVGGAEVFVGLIPQLQLFGPQREAVLRGAVAERQRAGEGVPLGIREPFLVALLGGLVDAETMLGQRSAEPVRGREVAVGRAKRNGERASARLTPVECQGRDRITSRSSRRDLTPSFTKTLLRWYSTVRGLMNSRLPISGLLSPSAANRAI